jgi:hypothetical protein
LFEISKRAVWEAFRRVKANKGGIGVDEQSIAEFEQELQGNLYKLWNRLSSGSLFPAAGYVERWLKAPLQRGDDSLVERDRGTAQGSAMTAPMQSRASNSSGRFGVRRGGVGREAGYSRIWVIDDPSRERQLTVLADDRGLPNAAGAGAAHHYQAFPSATPPAQHP